MKQLSPHFLEVINEVGGAGGVVEQRSHTFPSSTYMPQNYTNPELCPSKYSFPYAFSQAQPPEH